MLVHLNSHVIPERAVSEWLLQMAVFGLAIALTLCALALPVI
ncbi:MAG: hypothetical protein AAFX40_12800 [Cyanobacteria bacterium J06639_1]